MNRKAAMSLTFVLAMSTVMLSGCAGSTPAGSAGTEPETVVDVTETPSGDPAGIETEETVQARDDEPAGTDGQAETEAADGSAEAEETGSETMTEDDPLQTAFPLSDGITIPELKMNDLNVPSGTAFEYVRDMGVGFNLGNTFDAYNDDSLGDEMSTETYWQHDRTTQEMIHYLHEYGFDSIRIPVSWHNHVNGDYVISKAWLDRVNEVVDWAIAEDMHVIINIHHDNHLVDECLYPDREHLDQSLKYVTAIWSQLSDRFREYDDSLIFESMNEPRLVGHDNEWWIDPDNADCVEAIGCINELNQAFVDVVRQSGGNNETRYLMVPGYDASIDGATHKDFVMPTDPADPSDDRSNGHVLISIHGYTPYQFALEYPGTDHFDPASADSTRDLDSYMNKLYTTFVKNGVPVVIGEYGSRDKNGNLQDRVSFTAYYVRMARGRGMACLLWDNNAWTGDGELFGVFNRKDPEKSNFDVLAAIMTYKD